MFQKLLVYKCSLLHAFTKGSHAEQPRSFGHLHDLSTATGPFILC